MSTTAKSDIDQRIRKVAIVVQTLDSATAKNLLAQLPNDIARQVKLAMVKLGAVTAQERADAMNGLQELFGATVGKQSPVAKNSPYKSTSSENSSSAANPRSVSPAAALLAMQGEDQFDWSDQAASHIARAADSDLSATYAAQNASHPESETPWLAWAPQSLANLLANERPTVIATVLNQLSPERAKLLLDHLPVETAGATLAAIPSLFLVDPSILTDILAEIERKLPKQPPVQTTANIAGIAKLAAIVDQFQGTQRQAWLKAIAHQNADVASQLGWEPSGIPPNSSPLDAIAKAQAGLKGQSVVRAYASPEGDANGALVQSIANQNPPVAPKAEIAGQTEPVPVILPIGEFRNSSDSNPALDAASQAKAFHESNVVPRQFDDLLKLSDGDLVTLLHSCDRETVLRAVAGSGAQMRIRIERLIPEKDLKKFRTYLKKLPNSYLQASQAAQNNVLEQASQLMKSGRIASMSGFTFLAAA